MSSTTQQPAIRVRQLGKQYQLGARQCAGRTFREVLVDAGQAPFKRFRRLSGHAPAAETFWALDDISFDVQPGEAIGIIGRNGAGKSTLLKILSRITEPTRGRVELEGRVSSLLEVGTGFHAELTGRENIFLNGAILGMTRGEIKRKFDEIVAFAEVERFLDTQVKHYSSGMYVRLAFAVAAHLEPEIFVVDEVLAVGDAAFQKKCLGKMREVAGGGRTVLFVSHNMGAVQTLCGRAMTLIGGRIADFGEASAVVRAYLDGFHEEARRNGAAWINPSPSEDADVVLKSVQLCDSKGVPRTSLTVDEPVHIVMEYDIRKSLFGLRVAIQVQTFDGVVAFTNSEDSTLHEGIELAPGEYRAQCIIPGNLLNNSSYMLLTCLERPYGTVYEPLDPRIEFTMVENTSAGIYPRGHQGVVRPRLRWKLANNHGWSIER